jgi:restriction system protein
MSVPDFQSIMLPFLKVISDERVYSKNELRDALSKVFNLSELDLKEKVKSGSSRFENNIAWVKVYFNQAGLVNIPVRGKTQITQRGLEVLRENPSNIDIKYLMKFPEFVEFKSRKKKKKDKPDKINKDISVEIEETATPVENIEKGIEEINNTLKDEIYEYIMKNDYRFFEELVVKLLGKMGYGNELEDLQVTKRTGDEGIDGIVKEDKLGLEYIYIQAKKWESNVGRDEIHKFVGALAGKKAKKGVFFSTSDYSKGAYEYAQNVENTVILINKEKLLDLIIEFNLGLQTVNTYEIKKIDSDFYDDNN